MTKEKLLSKCIGSFVGGAVGDALGYAVEFSKLSAIRCRFGERGISRYVLDDEGKARFSDDTQMSLFTAEGILNNARVNRHVTVESLCDQIERAYQNWYITQTENFREISGSELSKHAELWNRRAPGMTCLGALYALRDGKEVKNNSKGCGTVMRVASLGFFSGAHPEILKEEELAKVTAIVSEITHKHIDSTASSVLLTYMISHIIKSENIGIEELKNIIESGFEVTDALYGDQEVKKENFKTLIRRAIELGESDVKQPAALPELGEGWVADEALAIAIYSVVSNIGDFEGCMVCAVNHDGDSDSTGAIAGNILGAILGYEGIPEYYIKDLELVDVLKATASNIVNI